MPEMPEVETVARKLRGVLIGKRIAGVVLSGLPLRRPVADDFGEMLRGRAIRKIHRRGKYLIAELDPTSFLLVHLGMSGRLFYSAVPAEAPRHTHAIIRFGDGSELQYRDHRRFGLLSAYEVATLPDIPELQSLGRNPLGTGFNEAWLKKQLGKTSREVKSFLLDQRQVAGLGNIYVCEALFHARIHPARRCNTLGSRDTARLVGAVRTVLRAAIRHRGTSFSDFIDSDGQRGAHQSFLAVFQREGERCGECGQAIRRLRQGNRSSFYCPRCQK